MRAIVLFLYPEEKSTLIVRENGEMAGNVDFVTNKGCRDYILKRYNSLGSSFDEIWDKVTKHNEDEKERKEPFFWDDPSIKIFTKDI